MPSRSTVPNALIVSGDTRIEKLLARDDTLTVPAYACRFDGFVNDTFTEYANASVYRPSSVCNARLVSTLQNTAGQAGGYHLGFTMYTTAGQDEPIEIWIGHRLVARARIADPDNRVHLFVVPEKFAFRGGETLRLVTSETSGPCRIENVVFLKRRPEPTIPELNIQTPHVDVRHTETGLKAYLTWITNCPASGRLRWGNKSPSKTVRIKNLLVNHEIVLDNLDSKKTYQYEIQLKDRTGLEASYKGSFKTDLPSPKSRTQKARFPLQLRRSSPTAWPVSTGVPFSKGTLGSTDQLRLLNTSRTEIPVQTRSLTRWPDGSIQWALLDFHADGQNNYTVEYGSQITRSHPENALQIDQNRIGITITTGPIRVEFSKTNTVFPGIVSVRQSDGSYQRLTPAKPSPAITLTTEDGTTYRSGKPIAITLEESGSERACVRIELDHTSGAKRLFRSTFRIHLFRNSSALRVLHTFENNHTENTFTHIRELTLRSDLNVGTHPQGRTGRQKQKTLSQPITLNQTHDNAYTITQGRSTLSKGKRADGSVDLSGSKAGVTLSVRDFWQNYPKGLSIDEKGISIQICPPLKKNAYPKDGELTERLYYHLLNGHHKLKSGIARTHELWFHIRTDGSAPSHFNTNVQAPPLYSISLNTFNKSRSITQLPSKENSPYPPYEAWVDAAQNAYAADRKAFRAYGMLNFGDWFGERVYNWGNLEYDTPWCFLQEYLRGGHPDFYTWAEEASRHLTDVDTCHHGNGAGDQYLHCVGHVGNYYPDGFRETAIFSGRSSVSHTWLEGPFLYALLSGDARILECAQKTADTLIGNILNHYDFTNCRNSGWHLIHLAAAYKATGRRVYLNSARIIVDRVLERQRPSGGWDRLMVPGHCLCHPPRHTGNAGFMVGILAVGLKRFYEATGDRRVRNAIVRSADYCINAMWVPETATFHYTSCPESRVGAAADMRILKAVATAYRFSGRKKFKDVLEAGIQTAIDAHKPGKGRGSGKGIGSPMRGAAQLLVDLPVEKSGKKG